MRTRITAGIAALAIAAVAASATDASAQRWHHRHHGGWGWGAGAGFAAGALLGGALASRPYYGGGYYSGPGYYAAAPGPSGNAVAYCSQRFKSYDPASGTYLGYDGERHPCP